MSLLSFLTKIPWRLLISKGPDIAKAVKELKNRASINLPEKKENLSTLEKLAIEQAHVLANLSDEMNCAREQIEKLGKEISLLFTILLAVGAGLVVCIIALIMIYIKVA